MNVKQLKRILNEVDEDLPVVAVFDLNDWPGDSWSELNSYRIARPIDFTTTGSANEGATKKSLIFDLRA